MAAAPAPVIAGAAGVGPTRRSPGEVLSTCGAHVAPLLLAVLLATLTYPLRLVRWHAAPGGLTGIPSRRPARHAIAGRPWPTTSCPFAPEKPCWPPPAWRAPGSSAGAVVGRGRTGIRCSTVSLRRPAPHILLPASDPPPTWPWAACRFAMPRRPLAGAAALAALLVVAFPAAGAGGAPAPHRAAGRPDREPDRSARARGAPGCRAPRGTILWSIGS